MKFCQDCPAQVHGKKRLCEPCRYQRVRERRGYTELGQYLGQIKNPLGFFTCKGCGVEGYKRPGGLQVKTGVGPQWCTQSCRKAATLRQSAEAEALAKEAQRKSCTYCGNDCYSRAVVPHCEACAKTALRTAQRVRDLEALRSVRIEKNWNPNCSICGKDMASLKALPKYCSRPCALKSHRQSAAYQSHKSAHKALRRMVQKAATVERFSPLAVLERDKWRCHICGDRTPRSLRGTTDPKAPELDHIIPLALGGEHSMANTACACRACNGSKGARALGQLGLGLEVLRGRHSRAKDGLLSNRALTFFSTKVKENAPT